jgi:hypothetical protein
LFTSPAVARLVPKPLPPRPESVAWAVDPTPLDPPGTPYINPSNPNNIIVPATDNVAVSIDLDACFTDPNGELYCFVDGLLRDDEVPPDTDWGVVLRGQVALSLLPAQPVASTWPGGPL